MRARSSLPLLAALTTIALIAGCVKEDPEADQTTTATGSVTSDAEARDAVRRTSARMATVWPSENLDSILPNFADDAVLMFPDMPDARGQAAVRESLKTAFGMLDIQSLDTEVDTIEVFGNVAYEWGRYRERYTETGKQPTQAEGRYIMRWQRENDGTWRLTRFTGNTVKEQPAK